MVSKQMCILAVDFGRKRVGLALSRSGSFVVTRPALTVTTAEALLKQLNELISAEQVTQLVIGDGINQSGLQHWLGIIQKGVAIPVVVVDEASTTHEAQQRTGTTQHHADSAAAAIILERYIEDLLQ